MGRSRLGHAVSAARISEVNAVRPLLATLALLGALWPGLNARAHHVNHMTVENRTGQRIDHLFIVHAVSRQDGFDLLVPGAEIGAGESRRFYLGYPGRCGNLRVTAVSADRQAITIESFRVCDGQPAILTLSHEDRWRPQHLGRFSTVAFENGTDRIFRHLFVTPEDAAIWGADHLPAGLECPPGCTLRLRVPTSVITETYGVLAIDDLERNYSFAIDVGSDAGDQVYEIEPSWVDPPGD